MSEVGLGVSEKPDRWRRPISPNEIIYLVRISEFCAVLVTGLSIFALIMPRVSASIFHTYISTSILGAIFSAIIFHWVGSYEIDAWSQRREALRRILVGACLTAAVLLSIGFAFKVAVIEISRLWSVAWFLSSCSALLLIRTVAIGKMRRLRAEGRFDVRVLIYGANPLGERLLQFISDSSAPMTRVVGFADDRVARTPRMIGNVPVVGGLDALEGLIRRGEVDEVVVALPWLAAERIHQIVTRLAVTPVPVRLAPDLVGFRFVHRSFRALNGLPLLEVSKRPMSRNAWINKGVLDRTVAIVATLLFLPALVLIAVAIKLDSPGPIFFRQDRIGFNNRTIRVWKFRTMRQELSQNDHIMQAQRNDPRVTKVGKFSAANQPRRAPAAMECARRRDVDRRSAATRAVDEGRWPDFRSSRRILCRASQGEARNNRLGTGQWLAG